MRSTSTSERPASKSGVMSMSANNRRKLLSVLCSSSSDEVQSVAAGPHSSAVVGLRLKTLCPVRTVLTLHVMVGCRKLDKVWKKSS